MANDYEIRCVGAQGSAYNDTLEERLRDEVNTQDNRGWEPKAMSIAATGEPGRDLTDEVSVTDEVAVTGCAMFKSKEADK